MKKRTIVTPLTPDFRPRDKVIFKRFTLPEPAVIDAVQTVQGETVYWLTLVSNHAQYRASRAEIEAR